MQKPGDATHRWIDHTVLPEEDEWQVREILLRSLRLSRQMIKRLTQSEGVQLDGMTPYLSSRVRAGQRLTIRLSPGAGSGLRPVPMPLEIVLEDADLLVVNKPARMLVHPSRPSHVRTLAHGVLAHFADTGVSALPHPVHRLDRDTTGLVLFAKHSVAHQRLDRQMRGRLIKRTYLAVVAGLLKPREGRIVAAIGRSEHDAHLRTSLKSGAPAATRFRVVEQLRGMSIVEIELETGRTHQIRVHFADAGHPLIGDISYGGPKHPAIERQALHARRLSFQHPMSGLPVACEAMLPDDLRALLERATGS